MVIRARVSFLLFWVSICTPVALAQKCVDLYARPNPGLPLAPPVRSAAELPFSGFLSKRYTVEDLVSFTTRVDEVLVRGVSLENALAGNWIPDPIERRTPHHFARLVTLRTYEFGDYQIIERQPIIVYEHMVEKMGGEGLELTHGERFRESLASQVYEATEAMDRRRGFPVDQIREASPRYWEQSRTYEVIHARTRQRLGTLRYIFAPFEIVFEGPPGSFNPDNALTYAQNPDLAKKVGVKVTYRDGGLAELLMNYRLGETIMYRNFLREGRLRGEHTIEEEFGFPWAHSGNAASDLPSERVETVSRYAENGSGLPLKKLLMEEVKSEEVAERFEGGHLPRPGIPIRLSADGSKLFAAGIATEWSNFWVNENHPGHTTVKDFLVLMSFGSLVNSQISPYMSYNGSTVYSYGDRKGRILYHGFGFRPMEWVEPFSFADNPWWFVSNNAAGFHRYLERTYSNPRDYFQWEIGSTLSHILHSTSGVPSWNMQNDLPDFPY